jgi:RHH-type rel operon transcriptional repressor/antitoxin RelB
MNAMVVRIPKEIEARLNSLAKKTGRPKSYYVREALIDRLNDLEDYYLALERLNDKNAKYYTTAEAKKKLGL